MTPIYVFATALFVAGALGLNDPCTPGSFRGTGFDVVNVRPVSILHDKYKQATLYRSLVNEGDFSLIDYKKGVFYSARDDGSCTVFKHKNLKNLLNDATSSNIMSYVSIFNAFPADATVYEYYKKRSQVTFRFLQHRQNLLCNLAYVGVHVKGVMRVSFFHEKIEEIKASDGLIAIKDLTDALTQMGSTTCTPIAW